MFKPYHEKKIETGLAVHRPCIVCFSCSKNEGTISPPPVAPVTPVTPPVVPPAAEITDTLGAGWERIVVDTSLNFYDVFFVDKLTGFLSGNGYVGKSTDGGLTWNKVIPATLNNPWINLFFTDANNGWAFSEAGYIIKTRDGGATWQRLNYSMFNGQFFDADHGYLIMNNASYKTIDGGATLIPLAGPQKTKLFADSSRGWLYGNVLSKTKDGGKSFSILSPPGDLGVYAMQFTDSLHGWLAGSAIYRTVDGGVTFEIIKGSNIGGDIYFADNNSGFILSGTRIYSTTDGGNTLSVSCRIHKSELYEIHFTDLNHGWATGKGGCVYRYVKP